MSKKYKGKVCVYCGVNTSDTADHIFAREFFLQENRQNLPKVPACKKCNSEKSVLEHYATTVLPFGGRGKRTQDFLKTMVRKRLAKNYKLHVALFVGKQRRWRQAESGVFVPGLTLPFDYSKIEQLYIYIRIYRRSDPPNKCQWNRIV